MDPDEREIEHRLGHEVAIRDRIEAVVEHPGKAEVRSVSDGIDRERRAGERSGSQRRHVEARARREQPVDVTGERPAVGEKMMSEQHRLRTLQVGVARQVRVAGVERPPQQHLLQPVDPAGDVEQLAFAPQAEIGGNLIVAAARGVELRSGGPGKFGHPALDRGVDVLVALDEREGTRRHLGRHGVERLEHGVAFGIGEQADSGEPAYVGRRSVDVVTPHRSVEGQADRVRHQCLRRTTGESSVPQRLAVAGGMGALVIGVAHVTPVPRGRGGVRTVRRRRSLPRRTSACRRRRRCRAVRRRGCGPAPRRRRGRNPAVCAR